MDWERTLSIFIIAFLLLNLVFITKLWLVPTFLDPSNYVSSEEVEATLQKLEHYDIMVTAKVPRKLKRAQLLEINRLPIDEEQAISRLIGDHYRVVEADSKSDYRSPLGQVTIYKDGRLHYTTANPAKGGNATKATASKRAEVFLTAWGKPGDAVVSRADLREDGIWVVEYIQRWRRETMFTSRITLFVDGSGSITEMRYFWVEIAGFAGENLLTIPATTALAVVAPAIPAGTTITDIALSWLVEPSLADYQLGSPVWAVETETGTRYYVNARTGELVGEDITEAGKTSSVLNSVGNIIIVGGSYGKHNPS